jgi:hypothetical protein
MGTAVGNLPALTGLLVDIKTVGRPTGHSVDLFAYKLNERSCSEQKIIKLRLETSFKSQISDWLKWRLVQLFFTGLVK